MDGFLGKLCKTHGYLSGLGELLEKARFTKLFNKSADFTFVVPTKTKFAEISKKTGKSLRKSLLKLFIPGSFKSPASWPEKVQLKEGTVKSTIHGDKLELAKNIIEYEGTMKGIPVWKSVREIKGGAFNEKNADSDAALAMLSPAQWATMQNATLNKIVALLYEKLDKENKLIADCLINGHPLAEMFLLYDSPFIKIDNREIDMEANPAESYDEILKKTGPFLVNVKEGEEKTVKLMKFLQESNIVNDNIVEFHEMLKNGDKWEDLEIAHKALSPYFVRISLFVAILTEIEEQIAKADEKESYDLYARAFAINATSDLKTDFTEFIHSADVETVVNKLSSIHALSGGILFKAIKTGSAQRTKPKPRKKITLRSVDKKKITSSHSRN